MMASPQKCSSCGEDVPEGSPLGLCPRCCLGKLGALDEIDYQDGPEIPGYEVVSELGTGAFGEVFECLQFDPAVRRVAVKVSREGAGGEARLREEAQILSDLEHEGIPRLLGAGELPDGRPFFAMELFEGQSLDQWWQGEEVTLRRGIEILQQVAATLAYAHERGVVHRDLKPSNILVASDVAGGWKTALIDFGVARATAGLASVGREATVAESLIGTPLYMAPEQLAGEEAREPTVDVHALGLLLGEFLGGFVLLGKVIDSEKSWSQNLDSRRHWSWPFPLRDWVREDWRAQAELEALGWVGEKATRLEPAERYKDAGEVTAELGRWLAGDAVLAGHQRFRYRARKFVQRRKLLLLGAAAVALGTALLANVWFTERSKNEGKLAAVYRSAEEKAQRKESDRLHAEALRALGQGQGGKARQDLQEALRVWPENKGARFAQTVLQALSPPAQELEPLSLPFVPRKVSPSSGGGWIVEAPDGAQWEIREGAALRRLDHELEIKEPSTWQGEGWTARKAAGGVLAFVREGDPFPLMEPIVYSEGSDVVAVDVARKRVAATTERKELARWSIEALGRGRERAELGVRSISMSMEEGTGNLWILDELGRMRGWAMGERPGFALGLGIAIEDFDIRASLENYSLGIEGGPQATQFLLGLEQWKRSTGARLLASARASDSQVCCYSGSNGDVLDWPGDGNFTTWPSGRAPASAIAVSREADEILWGGEDGIITLLDRKTRSPRWDFELASPPTAASLLDGGEAVVAREDGTVTVFSRAGEILQTISLVGQREGKFESLIYGVPRSSRFLAGVEGELVMRVFEASNGQEMGPGLRSRHGWEFFFLSVDGEFLVALDQSEEESTAAVRIWSLETYREVIPALEHPELLDWVCFSTDNRVLATSSRNGVIRRWSF